MDSPAKPDDAPPPAETPVAPTAAPITAAVIPQHGGTLLRLMAWTGWIGLMFCLLVIFVLSITMVAGMQSYFDTTENIREKYHSLAKDGPDKVAVIRLSGVILDGDGFVKRQIERVRSDDAVKAIVLRVDSPGGSVNASDYLLHHLTQLRKDKGDIPLVVSMGDMAASGGYYVAMAVGDQKDSIFAEPTTWTGSIGVIIPRYDISGLLERYDVKEDAVKSHPRKNMFSMSKPLSEEDRQLMQQLVDAAFDRFKEVVRQGRPNLERDEDALVQLATGEVFTAQQAERNGLVDRIGFIEDAIDRAMELASLDKETTRVIRYSPPPTMLDALGMAEAQTPPAGDLNALLQLATPRAYYLNSTLPVLVSSSRQ